MDKPHYNLFSKTMQGLVSSPAGSRISARLLHPLDLFFNKLSRGKFTYTGMAELPVVFVTTTGAKSGQPRTVPLLAIYDRENPEVLAVIASNWGQKNYPAWYHNMKAYPAITCSFQGQEQNYVAREADGDEYQRFWEFAQEVYEGYPKYQQRASHRRIPIMILEPHS